MARFVYHLLSFTKNSLDSGNRASSVGLGVSFHRYALRLYHQQFRSHAGHDTETNLITLCTVCHAKYADLRLLGAFVETLAPMVTAATAVASRGLARPCYLG